MLGFVLSFVAATTDIALWRRNAGQYGNGQYGTEQPPARADTRSITVKPISTIDRIDVQYNRREAYRGQSLDVLLKDLPHAAGDDAVLLHFANGMAIPVPLNSSLIKHVFIAVERRQDGAFVGGFPALRKEDGYYIDNRPLTFTTNKVALDVAEHPNVSDHGKGGFSPWRYCDSLVGIEWIQTQPYLAQFDVDTNAKAGFERFKQRCQFCHGARRVGASYGWDYVQPVALFEYRSPKSLYFHVKHRESDASEKGIMMPALSDFTEKDAADLWAFLKALAQKPLRPYAPITAP